MAAVLDGVDRVEDVPPGPELSAALAALAWDAVPNARLVAVVRAWSRQLAHDQAQLLAGLVQISHATPMADLPTPTVETVARTPEHVPSAAHEIAAGLTWTPTGADRELGFATALVERLPLVQQALWEGRIDRGKAWVFVEYLDPASGDLSEAQSRRLCEEFLPLAPGLTSRQLSGRLLRALHAIDPRLRRRRYERAVQARSVSLSLDPRTGAATLVGSGLPADEAAAAGAWMDRMVEATRRAGHPGTRPRVSADLFLGMLNGCFHGLPEEQIIARLLGTHRPEDHPTVASDAAASDAAASGSAASGAAGEAGASGAAGVAGASEAGGSATAEAAVPTAAAPETAAPETAAPENAGPEPANSETANSETPDSETVVETGLDSANAPATAAASGSGAAAGAGRAGVREGIEIRVGLATLAGLDDRPGEIPGLGPVPAGVARTAVATQRRGGVWRFAVVDTRGHLQLAGPLRRRPRTTGPPPAVRGGVVEVHLTVEELQTLPARPELAHWVGVLGEITTAWTDRDRLRRRLAANPRARFARGPLADHVWMRDRYCIGPGCTRPARRSDLDHTRDHGRGGRTVEANLGPACRRHHRDKDRGWSLAQVQPGLFLWVSPLGRIYPTRGEPVRPDLPDPDPAPPGKVFEEDAAELDRRLRRYQPRILEPPAGEPPRPPPPEPPEPRSAADEEPPF